MLSIEELLPLLDGVSEQRYVISNAVLKPGEYIEWRASLDGLLSYVFGYFNNRYASVSHNIWIKELSFSPFTVFSLGLVQETNCAVWCPKYDTTTNTYALVYSPRPYKAFKKDNFIRVTAPTVDPLTGTPITTQTVVGLDMQYIYITSRQKFVESLRSILGVKV